MDPTGKHIFRGPHGERFKPDAVRRIFIKKVINPLSENFPSPEGEKRFVDGRFHSFRHYFCSKCANSSVPERMVMSWLGHANSEMIRHYYHLHDEEAKRRMDALDFLGRAGGRSAFNAEDKLVKEDVDRASPEQHDDSDSAD